MKAAVITGLGGPEVVKIAELDDPHPGPNEALIQVEAVGLNWLDVLLRRENMGLSFPHVPGSDVVGIVRKSKRYKEGTRVVVNPGLLCKECEWGCPTKGECQFVRILGAHTPGGCAELLKVPEEQLYEKPEHLSIEEAAAFPLDFLTAWRMLSTKARLRPGQVVLIWGASGGLGSAAIGIARYLGATVIAASGKESYREDIAAAGAHHIVNYTSKSFEATITDITAGRGPDVVFESTGAATMAKSIALVRPGGTITICGTRTGETGSVDFSEIYYKQIRILGSRMGTPADFSEIYAVTCAARLRPIVGRIRQLDDVVQAHLLLEKRDFVGKVVLRVS